MNLNIYRRVLDEANYIVKYNATVRLTASEFKIGKSTVHKDMSERLQEIDMKLYEEVRRISDTNFKEKAIRGGLATQKKYMKKKKNVF